MDSPKKKNSEILKQLRDERNLLESKRTRTSMLLAARISLALKKKGWNKIKLAAELGKKPSVITRWLSGTHNFTSDTLSDIQEILGIQLLNLDGQETRTLHSAIFKILMRSSEKMKQRAT